MTRITLPSFAGNDYQPFEMRQLVSALELRFQQLEDEASIFPSAADSQGEFAPISHAHVETDIIDLGAYLLNINNESIFDLIDVNGTPQVGYTLVWDGTQFLAQSPSAASFYLRDLIDVSNFLSPNDGDVLSYNAATLQWVASSSSAVVSLADLTDTDLTGQAQYDLLFNATGSIWRDTQGEIIWNPTSGFLQLANTRAINWLDVASTTSVEFLTFEETASAPVPDPNIASVVALFNAENAAPGATTIAANVGTSTLTKISTGVAEVSTEQAKFGAQSLKTQYVSGINFGMWEETAKNASLDLGADDFTIEFWVYATQLAGSQYLRYGQLTGSERAWHLVFTLSGNMQFFYSTSGGASTQSLSVIQAVSLGSWHHIAVTREGTTSRLFFNGALINTGTITGTLFSGASQRLTLDNSSSLSTWWVDDLRITKGVARYTGAFTPPTATFDTGAAAETFFVGDPGYNTQIDGDTIRMVGNAIDINGVDPTTHLGEVTGGQSLTVDVTAITAKVDIGVECDPLDDLPIHDDSVGDLKKVNVSVITDGGYF